MRTSVRRSAIGAVLLTGAVGLTACGGEPLGGTAAPAQVSEAAATAGATPGTEPASAEDLAAGLLPEEAFGPDATVVQFPVDGSGPWDGHWGGPWGGPWHDHDGDGHDGHGHGHGPWGGWWTDADGLPEELAIEPAACADALAALPQLTDEEMPAVAGQAAWTDQLRTFQVLAEGPALDGLALPVDDLVAACSEATIAGPYGMDGTVTLTGFDVPARGEAADGVAVTVTHPFGTTSALVGLVTEGPRALMLAQTGATDAAPDQAAFAALLDQAADAASIG